MISEDDKKFLKTRRRFASLWNLAALFLFALIGITAVWMYGRNRHLIDPFYMIKQLQTETISKPTIELMAVMMPLATLACIMIVIMVVILGFGIFANERRYMRIIDSLISDKEFSQEEERNPVK